MDTNDSAMNRIVVRATSGENGSIHVEIPSPRYTPGEPLEVSIAPRDPRKRYEIKFKARASIASTIPFDGDAVEVQRRMRDEWPD